VARPTKAQLRSLSHDLLRRPPGGGETRRRLISFPSRKPKPSSRASRKMSKSCKGLAMELVKCLSETDCVKVSRGSSLSLSRPSLCRRLFRFDSIWCARMSVFQYRGLSASGNE
jgi:hypothetical protein